MAADNNLEKYALEVLSELRFVGSNEQLNILVLIDRSPGFDFSYGNWTGTKLFRIRKGSEDFSEDELLDCGEMDMTDPLTLEWFLEYTNIHFKAEKTILSIWSHGNGVYTDGIIANANFSVKSIVADYTTGGSKDFTLSIQDLEKVLEKNPVEILIFDACLMSMIESVWQITDYAHYLIASQLDIPAGKIDYSLLISLLMRNNYEVEDFLQFVPELYITETDNISYSINLTVIDLEAIGIFKNTFCLFCGQLVEFSGELIDLTLQKRKELYNPTPLFPEYCDLENFLGIFLDEEIFEKSLSEQSSDCINLLKKAIISYSEKNMDNNYLHGISINIPCTIEQYNAYIKEGSICKIYEESNFSEFLKKLVL